MATHHIRVSMLALLLFQACSGQAPVATLEVSYAALPESELRCAIVSFAERWGFRVSEADVGNQPSSASQFFYYLDYEDKHPVAVHNIGGEERLTIFIYSESIEMNGKNVALRSVFQQLSDTVAAQSERFNRDAAPPSNCDQA